MKAFLIFALIVILIISVWWFWTSTQYRKKTEIGPTHVPGSAKAVLAGGCFWCVEADFEKLKGVLGAISGYSGGKGDNPNYENYAELGYREAVEVTYDPQIVNYADLVEYLIRHSDPTDPDGSFFDRGPQYAPAVYYQKESEKEAAEKVIARIDEQKIFEKPLALKILPAEKFWPAEEYHQDYYLKNPLRYKYYRHGSGRDVFIEKHWGENKLPVSQLPSPDKPQRIIISKNPFWEKYQKPAPEELKKKITPIQFHVTQEDGTEPPFDNPYYDKKDDGIYVDLLSGEPLFSSRDKYDSGTGWPSFVRPIAPDAVVEKEDRIYFNKVIEIRSRYSDSHIGHIINDGLPEWDKKRYCMNSASLRFVPREELEAEGYGEYQALFQ